jgi:hypothetical protein
VKNTNGPVFVRIRVAGRSSTFQQEQDDCGCAGGESLTDRWQAGEGRGNKIGHERFKRKLIDFMRSEDC